MNDSIHRAIKNWSDGALAELVAARVLFEGNQFRQSLFWSHLAVEKALKAHVVKHTMKEAPYTHSLPRLAQLAELDLPQHWQLSLDELNAFQVETRYGNNEAESLFLIDKDVVQELAKASEEIVEWLIQKL